MRGTNVDYMGVTLDMMVQIIKADCVSHLGSRASSAYTQLSKFQAFNNTNQLKDCVSVNNPNDNSYLVICNDEANKMLQEHLWREWWEHQVASTATSPVDRCTL